MTHGCTPNLSHRNVVSENEILKIIKKSLSKSCLLDPVHTFLLKDCVDILLPSITKLVNLSLTKDVFPKNSRRRMLFPLIKKTSIPSEDLKNHCLVSGQCFMSKLVEQVVVQQLVHHIKINIFHNPHQSANKTGLSTKTAILHITNDIHLSWSCGEPTAHLLDLFAIFNTTDDDTLLNSWFGMSNMALKWSTSYLSQRFQAIKIE